MPFAITQMCSLKFAMPDVCLTPIPTPAGPVPVPIPYPNISLSCTAIPSQFKVMTMCMPNHNLMTIVPMSNGDNAGVMMNPLSGMVMGPTRHLFGSVKTFMGGMPATKMLSPSGQNGLSPGSFGMALTPSQVKLLILS
ncbi:MAG: DUF4150 domain-containing protein [Gammaproteobacteria bacterium]|nr:DUF4150 domain-containing protein [Gammaproteobacteria bacterium]